MPVVRTNVDTDEMKRMVDDALVSKRARLTGETKAQARAALISAGHISAPEPKKKPAAAAAAPAPETDSEEEELFRRLGEDEDVAAKSGKCPKNPRKPASSVRQTEMEMRGPNPKREGWKLPRKPYGHAKKIVKLKDNLTDTELKKMTSELPRRCLVDAVADWARENNKIVLPSITRADKAEIVATIKEHRIPVPKLSGGYYGDDMDGGAIPRDEALYEKAKSIVYPKYNKPSAYRSGALIKKYKELGGEFKEQGERKLARWFKEDWKDVGNKSYPVFRPTKRITKDTPLTPAEIDPDNLKLQIAKKQKIKGSKNLSPFFHIRGAASEYDWGGDEDVYYDEDGKEVSKDEYEKEVSDGSEEDLPEQPQFVGDPSQFKIMPFDPNNPMMYRGSGDFDDWIENERRTTEPYEIAGAGNKGDYLKTAKAFAKKAGYKDWNKIKYATDGVHKLELNGVKFGRKGYGDFIDYGMKDGNKEAQKHRKAYLARATNIKGSWKEDPMSKNNLAIKVLWGGSPFHHLKGGAAQPALPPNVDLVSKKESPVVEEIIEEPMDDTDIRAYYPNAKIMRYSDLSKYKTITQLLPKDKSYAFLLYQQEANSGHWVLIMRYGSTIEFFCSYGSAIDAPLKWTNPRDRQMLGEAVPYLSNLLKSQKDFNVIHNPVQYQSKGSDKATCGAHDVMRLSQMLNHGQDLTDYYDFMSRVKKESGLSYDEIVANFVSQR